MITTANLQKCCSKRKLTFDKKGTPQYKTVFKVQKPFLINNI